MPTASAPQRSRQRPRRRWLWLAALCVVLGLVTSVGVAWGIAWSMPSPRIVKDERTYVSAIAPALMFHGARASWIIERYTIEGAPGVTGTSFTLMSDSVLEGSVSESVSGAESILAEPSIHDAVVLHSKLLNTPQFLVVDFAVYRIGWPVRCGTYLRAFTAADANRQRRALKDPSARTTPLDPAFDLEKYYDAWVVGTTALPLRPIRSGLLADTAIFAGAWGVLIFTPLGVRRWLRARRGGCPKCGYSREGLKAGAVCPECGLGGRITDAD